MMKTERHIPKFVLKKYSLIIIKYELFLSYFLIQAGEITLNLVISIKVEQMDCVDCVKEIIKIEVAYIVIF